MIAAERNPIEIRMERRLDIVTGATGQGSGVRGQRTEKYTVPSCLVTLVFIADTVSQVSWPKYILSFEWSMGCFS